MWNPQTQKRLEMAEHLIFDAEHKKLTKSDLELLEFHRKYLREQIKTLRAKIHSNYYRCTKDARKKGKDVGG